MKLLSKSLAHTVKILNDLNYHDEVSIEEELGINKDAILEIIHKLKSYHINLYSSKKGYALHDHLSLLDEDYIKKALEGLNTKLEIFETIESTNDYLRDLGSIAPPSHICIAEHQTKARGRYLRKWHSPFGQNLYFSYAYPLNKDMSKLSGLSIVIGLAIINALNKLVSPKKLELKWPNDITCEGKKIAGILIDLLTEPNRRGHVIIGVGINVNMQHDNANNITQEWTSLKNLTGGFFERSELFIQIINSIISYINKFDREGFSAFIDEFSFYDSLLGKKIKVSSGSIELHGQARGVDHAGNLLIEEAGELKPCSAGEATIIKPKTL